MINFDDIKPGKLLVGVNANVRSVFQIISPLQELKTRFNVDILRENRWPNNSKYRNFLGTKHLFYEKRIIEK